MLALVVLVCGVARAACLQTGFGEVGGQGRAWVSSGGDATLAIDQDTGSCVSTDSSDNAWWQVDLGKEYEVSLVRVLSSNQNFEVLVSSDEDVIGEGVECASLSLSAAPSSQHVDLLCSNVLARYVAVVSYDSSTVLELCDVGVYAHLPIVARENRLAILGEVWPVSQWEHHTNDDIPQFPLSYSKGFQWVYLHGAVANGLTGPSHAITQLPRDHWPAYSHVFMCSAPSDLDFPFAVNVVAVRVDIRGLVTVLEPADPVAVSLDGIAFPFAQSTISINSTHGSSFTAIPLTTTSIASNFNPAHYSPLCAFAAGSGVVHLGGVVEVADACEAPACVIANLTTAELPDRWVEQQVSAMFPQPARAREGSRQQQTVVRVLGTGELSASVVDAGELLYFDGLFLLPSHESKTGTLLLHLVPVHPFKSSASSPPRVLITSDNRVFFAGQVYLEQRTANLNAFTVLTLPDEAFPLYDTRQVVACRVGGRTQHCALTITTEGAVSVQTDETNTSGDNWVAFDGVSYGGFVHEVSLSVSGDATITVGAAASIQFGSIPA